MQTPTFKTLKRLTWIAVTIFLLWAGGVTYLLASHRLDSPAMATAAAKRQPLRGTVIRREFIPPYWFTHVIDDAKGHRIVQDFQPQQFIISITLTHGTVYRFFTDQGGYDTLKLNRQWQSVK